MDAPDPSRAVCPACGDSNDACADFCGRCGAPVGRFTALDPLKAIHAEGWVFRRSASARIRPIVLVGSWVLFGAPVLAAALNAVLRPGRQHLVTLVPTAGLCGIYLLVLVRVTVNFIRNRPRPGPYDPGV